MGAGGTSAMAAAHVAARSEAQSAASRNNALVGSALVAEILPAITAIPGALFVRRNVGVARTPDGRTVMFGRKGQADIPGIVRGRAVEIECKAGKGELTKKQRVWRKAVERAGGLYIVARSPEQVVAEIQAAIP